MRLCANEYLTLSMLVTIVLCLVIQQCYRRRNLKGYCIFPYSLGSSLDILQSLSLCYPTINVFYTHSQLGDITLSNRKIVSRGKNLCESQALLNST